jgi:peptidyl-prolyl cis-trans isomerase SurA
MKKLLTAFFVLVSFTVSAQTLFYYGNDSVSVKEFLRAYQKNNTGPKSEKAIRDYLQLYIASRLKIKEAHERGYDTLPQIVADLDNLRLQIMPTYANDKQGVAKLVNEAFDRAQKDIHLAHIFLRNTSDQMNSVDTKKLNEVLEAVKKSDESRDVLFGDIAKKYSDDPAAQTNGGDLGWITVFSLPYELENLAYSIPVGKSGMYQSRAGIHIFKNLGERRDPGRMKASQILLAFPPDATEQSKLAIKKLADSLYNRLLKGDDFGKLASTFSNDVISAAANGQMQEFAIGQYDPIFEKEVYALAKDGDITAPFLTSHGYHIVKRISKTPIVTNKSNKVAMQLMEDKVEQSDRINTT